MDQGGIERGGPGLKQIHKRSRSSTVPSTQTKRKKMLANCGSFVLLFVNCWNAVAPKPIWNYGSNQMFTPAGTCWNGFAGLAQTCANSKPNHMFYIVLICFSVAFRRHKRIGMQFGFSTTGVGPAAKLCANRSICLFALNGRAWPQIQSICYLFASCFPYKLVGCFPLWSRLAFLENRPLSLDARSW